uniref:Uncharacterized protein n=1 Tax=Arundo donax TaxID=35708 RepID=A0A0A9G383_ARUDO
MLITGDNLHASQ